MENVGSVHPDLGWLAIGNDTVYPWDICLKTLGATDGSLPVFLSCFSVRQEENYILISWATESEMNNLGFIIQRRIRKIGRRMLIDEGWTNIATHIDNQELRGQGNKSTRTEYHYQDNSVAPGETYQYRLADVAYNGIAQYHSVEEIKVKSSAELVLPDQFILKSPYPNPFNPKTVISWQLPSSREVKLNVYNLLGEKVSTLVSEKLPAGYHEVEFNGQNLSSGVYLYRIEAGEWQDVKKMILIR